MKTKPFDPDDPDEFLRSVREEAERVSSKPKVAPQPSPSPAFEAVTLDDFFAYMPMHNYIYTPSREPWPGASVNARIAPIVVGVMPMVRK